ncbi:F-box only protein 3 isoform X2 [Gouania willdenowi]|uniref:F-box protein 3 n=1 Tax=Gouania willdenowi TaxID=441366 RepID=A0A8C5G1D7_GOUWI|nr:F-box only protein 3 isoform X2 [Gouania willdenowi]
MAELRLNELPTDPLLHVLSYLSYRELLCCGLVCRRLNELCKHNPLWRTLCVKHWLLTDADRQQSTLSWYSLFQQYHSDLGRYIHVYATLKRAWIQLKNFLQEKCPKIISSLKDGTSESELNVVEALIGCKLPEDYRCSYRIHNGQRLVIPGLMGSMSLSNHYRSEVLLDIETGGGGFQRRAGLKRCLPITYCFHTGLSQYLALETSEGRQRNETFYPCPDQTAREPSAIDMFITGSSFMDWFTSYVNNVVSGDFPIIKDQIFRYIHDQGCVETTDDITVSVSTSFLPELSSVHPPHFFFTYRIRMEMSSSASSRASCQLDSRYWKITKSDGTVEEVQGPGVVGEFPIMTPGKVHEYASCTTFSTPSEYMEGHYTFHRLANKDEVFQVAIPRFHMVCPPYRQPAVRTQKSGLAPHLDDDNDFCDGNSENGGGDDDDDDDGGGGGNYGDLHGINMAALEGAWCPRHI